MFRAFPGYLIRPYEKHERTLQDFQNGLVKSHYDAPMKGFLCSQARVKRWPDFSSNLKVISGMSPLGQMQARNGRKLSLEWFLRALAGESEK